MRKIRYIFSTIIFILLLTSNSYSAGSGGSGDGGKKVNKNTLEYQGKANYSKAVKLINRAKKLEKKNKIEKANKNYEKIPVNENIQPIGKVVSLIRDM